MNPDVTRRSLIRRALLILGLSPVGLMGCASRRVAGRAAPPVRAAPEPGAELSRAEMADLVAFGEALVEGRTLDLAGRQSLVEHISDRMKRNPGYIALYRTAVSTLDRLAGRPFASLEIDERLQLIARYRLVGPPEPEGENPGPLAKEMDALRMQTVPDLIRGYYGSPTGWAVVGYQTFPGHCGDLTRYTRAAG
jgi:hypothetical protein